MLNNYLIEDALKDDQKTNGEYSYHLQKESSFILLQSSAAAWWGRSQFKLTILGLLFSHNMILIYKYHKSNNNMMPLIYSLLDVILTP